MFRIPRSSFSNVTRQLSALLNNHYQGVVNRDVTPVAQQRSSDKNSKESTLLKRVSSGPDSHALAKSVAFPDLSPHASEDYYSPSSKPQFNFSEKLGNFLKSYSLTQSDFSDLTNCDIDEESQAEFVDFINAIEKEFELKFAKKEVYDFLKSFLLNSAKSYVRDEGYNYYQEFSMSNEDPEKESENKDPLRNIANFGVSSLQIGSNAFIRHASNNVSMRITDGGLNSLIAVLRSNPGLLIKGWAGRIPYNFFAINPSLFVAESVSDVISSDPENMTNGEKMIAVFSGAFYEAVAGAVFEMHSLRNNYFSSKSKHYVNNECGGVASFLRELPSMDFWKIAKPFSDKQVEKMSQDESFLSYLKSRNIDFAKYKESGKLTDLKDILNEEGSIIATAELKEFRKKYSNIMYAGKDAEEVFAKRNIALSADDYKRVFSKSLAPNTLRNISFLAGILFGINQDGSSIYEVLLAACGFGAFSAVPGEVSNAAALRAARGEEKDVITNAIKDAFSKIKNHPGSFAVSAAGRVLANLFAVAVFNDGFREFSRELFYGALRDAFSETKNELLEEEKSDPDRESKEEPSIEPKYAGGNNVAGNSAEINYRK